MEIEELCGDRDVSDINRPKPKPRNLASNFEEAYNDGSMDRPCTPMNNLSDIDADLCLTPFSPIKSNEFSSHNTVARVDRNLFNCRVTSTPMVSSQHSSSLPCRPTGELTTTTRCCKSSDNLRLVCIGSEELPLEYVNPFTPDGKLLVNKANAHKRLKRLSIDPTKEVHSSEDLENDEQLGLKFDEIELPERRRLSEFNVSRFKEEFVQLKQIGKGHMGCVFKCVNRMNGCLYAIKRTINKIKLNSQERFIRNEIYAHGILDHPNIVRNFSCWKEEGYVYIQNEYCNGGNLETYIESHVMSESLIRTLLLQIAHALRYMHHTGLVHMDVKPENILLSIDSTKENSLDSNLRGLNNENEDIVFKLGDLGHVTRLDEDNDVEEGDCRFLPIEILQMKYNHLDRADIFALGLTAYSAAGGGPLPKNGETWQDIRAGNLQYLGNHSKEFNDILKSMVRKSPEKRPTAVQLIDTLKVSPPSPPYEVFDRFQKYQMNNCVLEQKFEKTGHYLRVLAKSHRHLQEQLKEQLPMTPGKSRLLGIKKKGPVTKTRIVGKKTKRSASTTLF